MYGPSFYNEKFRKNVDFLEFFAYNDFKSLRVKEKNGVKYLGCSVFPCEKGIQSFSRNI